MLQDSELSKFSVFYAEAIVNDSSLPMLNRVRPIFEKMTREEFVHLIDNIQGADDYEIFQQFFYFLILFRDMKNIQSHINSECFPLPVLEKFIIFTFGYHGLHDASTEAIMDDILFFLDKERLLELAMNSRFIQNDKLLLFMMLARFDLELLDRYFNAIEDPSAITRSFLKLPDELLRGIISRNYRLFQYILLLMGEGESTRTISSDFFEKYKHDIELFSTLNDMIRQYREITDFEKERNLPFNMRNMSRISQLVNMAKKMPDPAKAVEYFSGEELFMDDMEKKIVLSVITDPMMKNVLNRFGA